MPNPSVPLVPYDPDIPATQYDFVLRKGGKDFHLDFVAAQISHHFRRCASGTAAHQALDLIPQKKQGLLPDEEQAEGYGIYAENGWDLWNVFRVLFVFQVPFFVFAAYWLIWIDSKDLQNALAPATYALMFITLLLGFSEYVGAA